MRKRIFIATTMALPVLAAAGYAAASGQSESRRGTAGHGAVPPRRRRNEGAGLPARLLVNAAGDSIITGCIAHPYSAGARWATTTSTRR